MSAKTTRWKDRGFTDKAHYAGWLHFNDLVDECKMYDDVYYDEYTGQVINITNSPDREEDLEEICVEEEDE